MATTESANNASAGGAMKPMITLGIPGSRTTAVLLGALMLYNTNPGPTLFSEQPALVWGLIASLYTRKYYAFSYKFTYGKSIC
ncbi:tripartite tricarboxylate transporter permease [Campylobacter fetus]|uniref:tripartite tricarboxylate transporter permease n=1 Tax=Campylobacter fetus TaxID=196 RepID=UPI00068809E8|nr:tripartite tricarboxylate transporter permease [Campylobacter fetus]OCS14372.1 hypothetical protein CFTD6856_00465 [Campylobacter fetus subsp. testudinum]